MPVILLILPLALLMVAAYRGFSVIFMAPLMAALAVLLVDPGLVLPYFTGIFMESLAQFVKHYFPVFLLGALFGKLMEISGYAASIARTVIRWVGAGRAILAIVMVCTLLTYGGVSLFVVVFAVYPFAAETFRRADIPKRLMPAAIALGAFTFTMDALPGSPQIQNIIPTAFFHTTTWAAPVLGIGGGLFILVCGMGYLGWMRRRAAAAGERYGSGHILEPEVLPNGSLPPAWLAALPLLLVAICNRAFLQLIRSTYGERIEGGPAGTGRLPDLDLGRFAGIWSVEAALCAGMLTILITAWPRLRRDLQSRLQQGVAGSLLATLNTASEYGFGAVIGSLPAFVLVNRWMSQAISDPLVNEAATISVLSAITGSASGGMSIALGSLGEQYLQKAYAAGIPPEVLHRVASVAGGGLDTLPHNGAIITLLAITGLTHRQSYPDIFVMTLFKAAAAFLIIGIYHFTGLV